MAKSIDQMIEEIEKKASEQSVRNYNGYDSRSVTKVVHSDNKRAIAYELKGSTWHRGGTNGGGVSYFQGINAYDGESDLSVMPYDVYRAKYYHEWDIFDILSLKNLGERKHEIIMGNEYRKIKYLVNFGERKVEKLEEENLKPIVISGAEANDW